MQKNSPDGNPIGDPQQSAQALLQAEDGAAAWWARPAEAWGCGERLLAAGAAAVADLRAAVFSELGFTTSAGAPCFLMRHCVRLRLASLQLLMQSLLQYFMNPLFMAHAKDIPAQARIHRAMHFASLIEGAMVA